MTMNQRILQFPLSYGIDRLMDSSVTLRNMLLVSSIPPCNCGVFSLNGSHINLGMKMFTDLLKRVAYLELYGN